MSKLTSIALTFLTFLVAFPFAALSPASAAEPKAMANKSIVGFKFPESVGCDTANQVLYVSEFGSELKPTLKDGKGRISKVSLAGHIDDPKYFPANGQVLNKPKGIWISGNRLWVTDIDAVWVFDIKTKEGRKLDLPGIKFANDPTVMGTALYVSDNRGDQLYRVEPADFLHIKGKPKIAVVFSGKSMNPNGLYPGKGGVLLMAGFASKDKPRAIYSMEPGKHPVALTKNIGRLDGLYQFDDGRMLSTDWNSGSLFIWNDKKGMEKLATGFKGPADFCVTPNDKGGLTAVVPDLVASTLTFVSLRK